VSGANLLHVLIGHLKGENRMYTTKVNKTIFHHNGDFSGDIHIYFENNSGAEILIPFDDIKGLVAEYIRREKISKLEDAEDNELLGV
jgi:hypothetical protein